MRNCLKATIIKDSLGVRNSFWRMKVTFNTFVPHSSLLSQWCAKFLFSRNWKWCWSMWMPWRKEEPSYELFPQKYTDKKDLYVKSHIKRAQSFVVWICGKHSKGLMPKQTSVCAVTGQKDVSPPPSRITPAVCLTLDTHNCIHLDSLEELV